MLAFVRPADQRGCVSVSSGRDADQRKGYAAHPVEDPVDDLDQRRVRPLQIVDHDDRGPRRGGRLQVASQGPSDLRVDPSRRDVGQCGRGGFDPEKDEKSRADRLQIGRAGEHCREMRVQIRERARAVVRAGDPCLCAKDLHQWPVRDARAVGQAAAAQEHGLVPQARQDLADEP